MIGACAAGINERLRKTIRRAVPVTIKNHTENFHAEIIESQSACGFADDLVDNMHIVLPIECVARNLRNNN